MQLKEWIHALAKVVEAHRQWVHIGCAPESSEEFGTTLRRFIDEWVESGKPALPAAADPSLSLDLLNARFTGVQKAWPPRYQGEHQEAAAAFWPLIDSLIISYASIKHPEPNPIETVGQLAGGPNPVSHEQIARIYGWTLPNGSPDVAKVRKELDKPGSQTDGGKYIPPDQREISSRREGALMEARSVCQTRNARLLERREPVENVPQHAQEGVSVGQLAKMTGKTREEVRAMLELAGVTNYVEDYSLDGVQDPRHSAGQRMYDEVAFGRPLDRPAPGIQDFTSGDEFDDDLLEQAAAAGLDNTPRM